MTTAATREGRYRHLVGFGRELGGNLRLAQLLDLVAREVRHVLGAERCSIFLLDEARCELCTRVAHGLEGREVRIPRDSGIAGKVLASGKALRVNAPYQDPSFNREIDRETGYVTRNILAVPLRDGEGKTFGVFEALNKKGDGGFDSDDEALLELLSSLASSRFESAKLFEDLRLSYLEAMQRLAIMAEFRDQEDTARHLRNISRYSKLLARAAGLPEPRCEALELASPLHDVGKVAIKDAILLKEGPFDEGEFAEMRKHCLYGHKILGQARSPLMRLAADIALTHHERWDGEGYPKGLKGEEIPFETQLVAVADVFDALTAERVYKRAWSYDEASLSILAGAGKQFSPRAIEAFREADKDLREAFEAQRGAGALRS